MCLKVAYVNPLAKNLANMDYMLIFAYFVLSTFSLSTVKIIQDAHIHAYAHTHIHVHTFANKCIHGVSMKS